MKVRTGPVLLLLILLIAIDPSLAQDAHARKPLDEWIAALKKGDWEASEALGPDGPYAKVAIPALIESLRDKDWHSFHSEPARTLSSYGVAVVPSLLQALMSPQARIRAGAAEALGMVQPKSKETIAPLIPAAKDADAQVRIAAIRSLGAIGRSSPEGMAAVSAAIQDQDGRICREAADVLGKWGPRSKPAVPALIVALKDKEQYTRAKAAEALGRIGPDAKPAVHALREALWDKSNMSNRGYFVQALGAIGPAAEEAVPDLLDALRDKDAVLRKIAAQALGQIGPEARAAIPSLIALAKEGPADELETPIWALGRIGPAAKDAVPVLLRAYGTKAHHLYFQYIVAEALGGIGPEAKAALPKLIEIAQDRKGYEFIRQAACEAIVKIDPATATKLNLVSAYMNIRLGKVAALKPQPRPALTEAEKREIKALIAKLAEIDSPDYGLSATFTGHAFAPLPNHQNWSMGLITDHRVKRSDTLRRLVEKGPEALPFLLEALEDMTPTKLKVRHDGIIGLMGFGGELDVNPLNPAENKRAAKEETQDDDDDELDKFDSYKVRVGDICFVVIGQIVGRSYQAVRYQPTAIIIVNSPTHRKAFRKRIRAIWSSKEPAQKLLDSLLLDYATEGIFNGESLDGWGQGSYLQIEAAMRLLYCFPKESAPMIAERLKRLDVGSAKPGIDDYMKRAVANGVVAKEFLEAVAWCKEPAIQEAIFDVFQRAGDANDMLAVLPYVKQAHGKLVVPRIKFLLENLPEAEDSQCGDGYQLLVALGEHAGKAAKPGFERYLHKATLQRRWTMCEVFKKTEPDWALEFLTPMLIDKRILHSDVRLCDIAAMALTEIHSDLKFDFKGTHAELDRRIEELREQIGRRKK